jgi:transposase
MITDRQYDSLDKWLVQAENSQIIEFVRFAGGLRSDYKAVKAALTYAWSNGQVEGQVNRLKLIKRQMYGKAGFALLRKRGIGPAPAL